MFQSQFIICPHYINNIFAVSVGLWTFIDQAINLRNPAANIYSVNTPFVNAITGSSTNVISFLGDKDSYMLMVNTGDLTVSFFKWTAMVFRESSSVGLLLNWRSDWPACGYSSMTFQFSGSSELKIGVCEGTSNAMRGNEVPLSLNECCSCWMLHDVAVSYDGKTGSVQVYTNGQLANRNIGLLAHEPTTGPVLVGSAYYCSDPNAPNTKYFKGKVACMRLWNIARALSTMRMNTPFCSIN